METLITFKTAKLAKEKGFSSCLKSTIIISWSQDRDYRTQIPYEPNCFLNGEHFKEYEYSKEEFKSLFKDDNSYSADVQIPSQSVLQKWLREIHKIDVLINVTIDYSNYIPIIWFKGKKIKPRGKFINYEEAMEEGLFQALNLI
jgi:hypothetical protein